MPRLLVLLLMFFVALAQQGALAARPGKSAEPKADQISTEHFLQGLLKSSLNGEALLKAYDAHYDGLSQEDKMAEKKTYAQHVYQDLLEHRKSLHE